MVGRGILKGLSVLVVEDEFMVSVMIEDILGDEQCAVVGPFDRLDPAMQAARTAAFDMAVLDVNIAGERVYPVAEILDHRHIPFVLLSGYGASAAPAQHPDWHVCAKPFTARELVARLEKFALERGESAPG